MQVTSRTFDDTKVSFRAGTQRLKRLLVTVASAPENSKPGLEQLRKAFGVVPNIAAAIANSPKLINSLVGVFQQVHNSSLSEQEIQIVLLTDAVTNASTYAVAFHTTLALQRGVSAEQTDAIRERRVPTDKRFAALSALAKTLIEKRGHLGGQDLDSFIAASFTREQILEVIAIVAASTIRYGIPRTYDEAMWPSLNETNSMWPSVGNKQGWNATVVPPEYI